MSTNAFADESIQWFLLTVRRQLARMDQAVSGIPDIGAATALGIAQGIRWQIAAFLNQEPIPATADALPVARTRAHYH